MAEAGRRRPRRASRQIGYGLRSRRPSASPSARWVRSLTWTMPRGSSSDSRNSGTRDTPAASNVSISSHTVFVLVDCDDVDHGTITSTAQRPEGADAQRHSRAPRRRRCGHAPAPLSTSSSVAVSRRPAGRAGRAAPPASCEAARSQGSRRCDRSPSGSRSSLLRSWQTTIGSSMYPQSISAGPAALRSATPIAARISVSRATPSSASAAF